MKKKSSPPSQSLEVNKIKCLLSDKKADPVCFPSLVELDDVGVILKKLCNSAYQLHQDGYFISKRFVVRDFALLHCLDCDTLA